MADPDPMTCDPGSRVYDPDPETVIPDPIYLVTTLIRASACFRCQFGPMSNSFPLFGKRTAEARNIPHEDIVYQRRTEARYVCQYQAECDTSTGVSQTVLSRRNSQARCHP